MITIQIELLNHRMGLKPWLDSSYSGTIEVPPSPARLLRAIGYGMFMELESQGLRPLPEIKKETVSDISIPEEWMSLLTKLSKCVPNYYIPPFTTGGCKTYSPQQVPVGAYSPKRGERLRSNYDAFAIFPENDSSIYAQYDIDLSDAEKDDLLASALYQIDYLGRSEYSADWSLSELPEGKELNCVADENGLVSSMAPTGSDDCVEWLMKSTRRCVSLAIASTLVSVSSVTATLLLSTDVNASSPPKRRTLLFSTSPVRPPLLVPTVCSGLTCSISLWSRSCPPPSSSQVTNKERLLTQLNVPGSSGTRRVTTT